MSSHFSKKHVFIESGPWLKVRWWKSWNSLEGRSGRWYPEWDIRVLTTRHEYQAIWHEGID